jgi:lysophospholipase L1-like esterase
MRLFLFFAMLIVFPFLNRAQNNYVTTSEDIIMASQSGASPLFFDVAKVNIPIIHTENFTHREEFKVREGLPNFFNKLKNGKAVTIGYLGGSITRADNQYRLQLAKFIQNMFPSIKINGINAGVSGTGTELGACRLYDQVLKYHSDLIFVEFAVNGAFPDGMEGIIRQIWKQNPQTDICLIYTISANQTKVYANGKVPLNIEKLEKIADHYAIPSVHMGLQAAMLENEGKLIWKADPATSTDKIVFSADGTHPLEAGGNLYAEAVARAMVKMKNSAVDLIHPLQEPLIADNWEDAQMLDPKSFANFSAEWKTVDTKTTESFNQFSGWFPYVMKAEKPGSEIRFKFNGTMLGLFDIGGPEVGQIELELDGVQMNIAEKSAIHFSTTKPNSIAENKSITENNSATDNKPASKTINRFNKFCNNRYRGQSFFITTEPGTHHVVLKIASEIPDKSKILGPSQLSDIELNPMKYNQTVIYVGKILIRGNMIQ